MQFNNSYLAITKGLHEANTQHQLSIESLTKQVEKLQEELKDERQLSSSLIKQDVLLVKAKKEELQRLIIEKKQLQEDHHHQLLLRDKEQQCSTLFRLLFSPHARNPLLGIALITMGSQLPNNCCS